MMQQLRCLTNTRQDDNMKKEILELLQQSDQYISGEMLSQTLNVTRTAIWKQINKLREEGFEIESSSKKGYRLNTETDHFHKEDLEIALSRQPIFRKVYYHESLDSTNTEAKRLGATFEGDERLIVANQQLAGKGRRGREWVSDKGVGIYTTFLMRPELSPTKASMLTLVAGLATAQAIKAVTGLEAKIKWPNDLVVHGKKVCGILTEMSAEMDYIHYVLVGVGVNVLQKQIPEELSDMATSLWLELKKAKMDTASLSRRQLLLEMVNAFEQLYSQFLVEQNLSFMLERYNQLCVNNGMALRVQKGADMIYGRGVKVDQEGVLWIETQEGELQAIHAGEVSVRGLYGYVE